MKSMPEQEIHSRPYCLRANEGEAYWFLSNRMTIKATSEATNGALSIAEVTVEAGFSPPWHVHHREDEMMYVLEGNLLFRCGDQLFRGGPGSFVFLPRDIPHSFKNLSDQPARWLVLGTPAGLDRFFIEAGIPAVAEGLNPHPPDFRKMAEVAARYGQEILGPSPF